MYCTNCGKEIQEGASFCSNCGSPISVIESSIIESKVVEVESVDEVLNLSIEPKENKVWGVFAKIGFISSLICLPFNLWFLVGGMFSIEFLVFSILGMKSNIYHGKALAGIIIHSISISILLIAISFMLTFQ